jgi:hypothetical protein
MTSLSVVEFPKCFPHKRNFVNYNLIPASLSICPSPHELFYFPSDKYSTGVYLHAVVKKGNSWHCSYNYGSCCIGWSSRFAVAFYKLPTRFYHCALPRLLAHVVNRQVGDFCLLNPVSSVANSPLFFCTKNVILCWSCFIVITVLGTKAKMKEAMIHFQGFLERSPKAAPSAYLILSASSCIHHDIIAK